MFTVKDYISEYTNTNKRTVHWNFYIWQILGSLNLY